MNERKLGKKSSDSDQVTFFSEEQDELSSPEVLPEQGLDLPASETPEVSSEPASDADTEKPKKKSLAYLCKESVIIAFFIFIGTGIIRLMRNSFTTAVFTAYDKTAAAFKSTFLYRIFFGDKNTKRTSKARKRIRRLATDARIPMAVSRLLTATLTVRTRIYGLILLFFGGVTLFVHFFINRYFTLFIYDASAPITGILTVIGAAFLIPCTSTLLETVSDSSILSALFFKLLGIKRSSPVSDGAPELSGSGACILGVLLGLTTLVFPAHTVVLALLILIYSFIVIKSPEAGLICVYLMTPFASAKLLTYSIAVLAVSYLFKAACGKRTIQLEFMDIFIAAFIFMTTLSGTITFGARDTALQAFLFTFIYLLSVSILRSTVWFERALRIFMISISAVTVYSVISELLSGLGYNRLGSSSVTDSADALGSVFNSLSVVCIILLCSFFYLLGSVITARTKGARFGYILLSLAAAVFLFRNLSLAAWSAAIISAVIFLLLMDNRSAIYMLVAGVMIPFLPAFGIRSVENFILSLLPSSQKMGLWNAVIRMFPRYGFAGIGNGTDAFGSVYPTFFIGNTDSVSHASSLIMQLTITLGFVGIAIFLVSLFFIFQSSFSYGRSCSNKLSKSRIMTYAGMCGLLAATIWGINEFIWYEPRMMLFYWELAALTVSTRRSALSSSENADLADEDLLYT